jgi:hypothetical protein
MHVRGTNVAKVNAQKHAKVNAQIKHVQKPTKLNAQNLLR